MPALTRPHRLRPGDRVVVVAPSGPVEEERLTAGCDILRGWGLDVEIAPHALDRHPRLDYLAGDDADRAGDFQRAWLDPEIAAVFAARGGYGAGRLVNLLDWEAMRAAPPKVFVGFSDSTVIHDAIATRLGLVTLYAPMVATQVFVNDGPARERLRRALFEPESVDTLTSPAAQCLAPGRAYGVTAGGCLCLIAATIQTPLARRGTAGTILLLEDVDEEPHRIDRMLTQLLRGGWLDGVAGIVLGSWQNCGPPDVLAEVFRDRLGGLGVPVIHELGFGHCESPLTIPLGVRTTLDASSAVLLIEP